MVSAASADRRANWVKAFSARVDCVAPKDRRGQLGFVRAEAKRQGLTLERGAAEARGLEMDYDQAREIVYGMPYNEWKAKYQNEATPEQQEAFKRSHPDHH